MVSRASSGGEDKLVDKYLLLLTSLCSPHTKARSEGSQKSLSLRASDEHVELGMCTSVAVVLGDDALECIESSISIMPRAVHEYARYGATIMRAVCSMTTTVLDHAIMRVVCSMM